MDIPTSAAIMVGLKVLGPPAIGLTRDLLARFVGPAVDEGGQALADPIREYRERRLQRVSQTVVDGAKLLESVGREPEPVPERILWPLLEAASREDDEDLQGRWAALLANSSSLASPNAVLPAFVEILRQLTPIQAQILDWMFNLRFQHTPGWFWTYPDVFRSQVEKQFNLSADDYALLVADLERLNVIEPRRDIPTADKNDVPIEDIGPLLVARWNSRIRYDSIGFTTLGVRFVAACNPPTVESPPESEKA
jgi:hypothetical protein